MGPALLPVGNRKLPPGTNIKDGVRSDIDHLVKLNQIKSIIKLIEDFGNQKQSTYLIWILTYYHITSNDYSLFLGFHFNFCLEFVY